MAVGVLGVFHRTAVRREGRIEDTVERATRRAQQQRERVGAVCVETTSSGEEVITLGNRQLRLYSVRSGMETTLTQNCALYLAQHRISTRRTGQFRSLGAAVHNQGPNGQERLTLGALAARYSFHQDKGR